MPTKKLSLKHQLQIAKNDLVELDRRLDCVRRERDLLQESNKNLKELKAKVSNLECSLRHFQEQECFFRGKCQALEFALLGFWGRLPDQNKAPKNSGEP